MTTAHEVDVIAHVRTQLLSDVASLTDAGMVSEVLPATLPAKHVQLRRIGGYVADLGNDPSAWLNTADISVHVRIPGDLSESVRATWALAGEVAAAIVQMASGANIAISRVREITAPQDLTDETRPDPIARVSMTFAVTYTPKT